MKVCRVEVRRIRVWLDGAISIEYRVPVICVIVCDHRSIPIANVSLMETSDHIVICYVLSGFSRIHTAVLYYGPCGGFPLL